MQQYSQKYSIIIPARNGIKYLSTCIESIITQDFTDYELIISDDHSTDGTPKYLETLHHPNIKKVTPPKGLSMAEHWGWALNQSSGEWIIFVGQDDGLQSYFFELAEILTKIAEQKNLRTIMSERAYYFWPGCDAVYGKIAVSYRAKSEIKILSSKFQALRALLGLQPYFELPEMYTTSLFSRKIIEEAKSKLDGRLFVAHPQDANLAAICCSLENYYLKSMIPLGWVGTSPKSAGLAISSTSGSKLDPDAENELKAVKADYLNKTINSSIKYNSLAGDFLLGSCQIYFWGALLQTEILRSQKNNKFLNNNLFKTLIFSTVLSEIHSSVKLNMKLRMKYFHELIKINNCSYLLVKTFQLTIVPLIKGLNFLYSVLQFLIRKFKSLIIHKIIIISYFRNWDDKMDIDMLIASNQTNKLRSDSKILDSITKNFNRF